MTPDALWEKTYSEQNEWREKFSAIPYEDKSGTWQPRYYQEIAVKNTLEAVAQNKNRILLTLATGTGKTAIAFQIVWKLFHTRWNLTATNQDTPYVRRLPRVLFLADRNILANQAYNAFSAFPEDAMVRIKPSEIKKKGKVPTNGSIFFTIFQSFMSGSDEENEPYFGEYPQDYFDLIIIDECHRGGANDEGNWRAILEYFSPAVQLGLTATPKRKDNVDTYDYFGNPVFTYSLKEGINDGFLTPFKVKRIKTTLDDYLYTHDDTVIAGTVEEGKLYKEAEFNRKIELEERERKRVHIFMDDANADDKSIIFCATQEHAGLVRDLVNQHKKSKELNYCVRVTANDGEIGEQFLREFQDNEKLIPTILTTSQKLSTGVDARNIRNIVLMRPVNQMIEFKQIVGRGTRLFEGKEFFTIYDFVDAYVKFSEPEWDGEPIDVEGEGEDESTPKPCPKCGERPCVCEKEPKQACEICGQKPCVCVKKAKVKLANGKEIQIQHMMSTSFWGADGKPISAEEFLQNLFGELPNLFKSEAELETLKKLIDAQNSDLFDVLEYVFNSDMQPISREARVKAAKKTIYALLNEKQREFISFVLDKYVETGVEELAQEKLPILLESKYESLEDAMDVLGEVEDVSALFVEFQKYLYAESVA